MMKILSLFRAEMKLIARSLLLPAVHLAACLGVMGFMTFLGTRSNLAQMLPGATGSAVMNCAAGMTALLGAARISRDREAGVFGELSSFPVGNGTVFIVYLLSFALTGLCETALVFAFSLIFGAPFSPFMLLSPAFALPEILFFSAVGAAAGCFLGRNGIFILCALGVSLGGIWLSHLVLDRTLLPAWLEIAVAVTPHAVFTDLIHSAFCPGFVPSFHVLPLSAAYTSAALAISAALMKKARNAAERNIFLKST